MSLSEWKSRVKFEYGKLCAQRKVQIRKAWRKNWKSSTEETAKDRLNITWLKPKLSRLKSSVRSCKSLVYLLNKCEPIPRMHNWVLSPRSFMAENPNTFLNVPFLSDELKKTDEKIVQKILKRMNNEAKPRQFDILEDTMFKALVKSLHENYVSFKDRKIPPDPVIFQAICLYSSSEKTPVQLAHKYEKLSCEKNDKTVGTCNRTLVTFKRYFCRRCFIYNCELHKIHEDNKNFHQNMQQLLRFKDPIKSFCVNNCWKQFKEQEIKKTQAAWNNDEKELFNSLQRIFNDKYCIIAQAMLTKTCKEVYDFARNKTISRPIKGISSFMKMLRQRRKSNKNWVLYLRQRGNLGARHFFPCYHPGKSCDNDCSCVSRNNACEKFCHCKLKCTNRFFGCRCLGKCNNNKCPCFALQRECDGDLCRNCGAGKYDIRKIECKNVSIQRGLRKHLLLAPSEVVGWGIFLKDGAKKNDFISEYTGEIISQKEANRRGKIYDLRNSSFLFDLNDKYVLDATYRGSKIRFANHSINPNCYAKVMMVLGNHRIGIFAKMDILPGEELFFNYQYNLTHQLQFVAIERNVENT